MVWWKKAQLRAIRIFNYHNYLNEPWHPLDFVPNFTSKTISLQLSIIHFSRLQSTFRRLFDWSTSRFLVFSAIKNSRKQSRSTLWIMQLILIVLLLTFLFARGFIRDDCYCGISNSDSRRITMGVQTKPFKYPWMVLMFSSHNKPYCGGALVSDSLVLSAAHCFSFTWEYCVLFALKNSILF